MSDDDSVVQYINVYSHTRIQGSDLIQFLWKQSMFCCVCEPLKEWYLTSVLLSKCIASWAHSLSSPIVNPLSWYIVINSFECCRTLWSDGLIVEKGQNSAVNWSNTIFVSISRTSIFCFLIPSIIDNVSCKLNINSSLQSRMLAVSFGFFVTNFRFSPVLLFPFFSGSGSKYLPPVASLNCLQIIFCDFFL